MFIRDVITQLRQELPLYTDKFTDKIGITSSSFAAGVVTIVTSATHGLDTDDIINIVDCQEKVPISDIITVDDIATVTTTTDHDLTLDWQDRKEQPPVEIIESTIGNYNGSQVLTEVPSRTTFQFNITGSPAQASDGFILSESFEGYSGIKTVTVIDSTTFTFTTSKILTANGNGGFVHSNIRVSGGVDIDRSISAYSKQSTNEYWIMVIPESTAASKSRQSENDATDQNIKGNAYRQKILPVIDVYMFIPSSQNFSGREAYDRAIEESIGLFRSLLGWRVPSPYTIKEYASIIFENHQPFLYNTSYYIHKFQFSTLQEITFCDTFIQKGDVAFRDIDMDMTVDFGTENTQSLIKLD